MHTTYLAVQLALAVGTFIIIGRALIERVQEMGLTVDGSAD